MTYGDSEPEDAWHPDDPTGVLFDNVARRLAALGEPVDLHPDRPDAGWLTELRAALDRVIRRRLSDLEQVRVGLLEEDLELLARRVADDG